MGSLAVVGVLIAGGPAGAEPAAPPVREIHSGLNLRSDLGTRQVRFELGARWHRVEATLVLDPLAARDGQIDHDLLVTRWSGDTQRWGLFAGWRMSSYSTIGASIYHQKLVVGTLARLPSIGTDRVRFIAGLELCAEVVRHGDMIEPEWFDYRSGRSFGDLVNFSLFVRAEMPLAL